jgi:hypothetical protein
MPVHQWARIKPQIFHDFHLAWGVHLSAAFNQGLLPPRFYALSEQHAGHEFSELMSLDIDSGGADRRAAGTPKRGYSPLNQARLAAGGPKALYRALRRTLAVRHERGDRLIALVEILSLVNSDRPASVADFVRKVHAALRHEVHVLVVDLFGPGLHVPEGMHGAVWASIHPDARPEPMEKPVRLSAYVACRQPEALLESIAPGDALPDMPLFLEPGRYVQTPLESTYQAAYHGFPSRWRDVLEGKS